MALFNRRKDRTISELEQYYASTGTRSGRAWAMAALSLLITIVVVLVLFFGGRWVYRTFFDNAEQTQITGTVDTSSNESGLSLSSGESQTTEEAADENASEDYPQVVSDQAASTSVASGSSTNGNVASSQTQATTPVTGDSELPNTGAGSSVVLVLIATTILSYAFAVRAQLIKTV